MAFPFAAKIAAQPGPQTAFLRSGADICIYGGAAGGGKTAALILEPLPPPHPLPSAANNRPHQRRRSRQGGGLQSFLRHSGLAQASEISGFEQGADVRYPEISGLQVGDA